MKKPSRPRTLTIEKTVDGASVFETVSCSAYFLVYKDTTKPKKSASLHMILEGMCNHDLARALAFHPGFEGLLECMKRNYAEMRRKTFDEMLKEEVTPDESDQDQNS